MKNDFDFIKDKFDKDNITAPESIAESNIEGMLPDKPRVRFYNKNSFRAVAGAVACFALVVGIIAYASPWHNAFVEKGEPDERGVAVVQGLNTFDSYADVKKALNRVVKDNYYSYDLKGDGTVDIFTEESSSESILTSSDNDSDWLGGGDGVADSSFAETYIQVEGVDEADKIKTDGKYIYYISDNNEVFIYDGDKLVSKISDYNIEKWYEIYDKDGAQLEWLDELYVKDDKLILNSWTTKNNGNGYASITNIYIYDISDIAKPTLINSFSQNGGYTTSRMIGDQLYVVSTQWLDYCKTEKECQIVTCDDGIETTLPASSIYYGNDINFSNYVVISAIDISTGERTHDSKAFFGCGDVVYCNQDNLYLYLSNFVINESQIIKAELGDGSITFTATANVNGVVNNQFSMDERNGYFRVATSDFDANNLYVFDSELNKVGEVTGFAKNETIQAVKYIGDMAYVITYEQTDPLFVIDLSNPTTPVIKGSVEITGFSSQLVPVDENTLLGIGYAEEWGIKLALFDISDSSSPKVLDSYVLKNSNSEAQCNHKAIVINREKGYFAIDYCEFGDIRNSSGALVFSVNDGKISADEKFEIDCDDDSYASRLTYIDDIIYVLDIEGEIYSFNY